MQGFFTNGLYVLDSQYPDRRLKLWRVRWSHQDVLADSLAPNFGAYEQ